jgi:cellulose synthase/poly-beta-1,6-N-acetylglucosamine synthase-like glycosyltransferase
MFTVALILVLIPVYVYAGYPVVVVVLGALRRKEVQQDTATPPLTLMIAAYNEEKGIAQKIEQSLRLNYPRELLSIVVVSDGSTDRTDAIVKEYQDRGVRLIRVEGRVGKTEARNQAVAQITTELVLFSDATTEYHPDIIRKLVRNFADPTVGMATGHLVYKKDAASSMTAGQGLYWQYESLIKRSQTWLGTLTGSVGCATAFRRSLYTALPPHIIEDFTEPLTFVMKGFRVVYEPEAVCYELPTQKSADEWKMRVRVVRGGIAGMLYARKILNPFKFPVATFQLVSHKILRWLVPVFGLLLIPVSGLALLENSENPVMISLVLGQVVFYLCALAALILEKLKLRLPLINIPLYFIVLNAACLVALVKTLTEPLAPTWETQR